MTNYSWHIPDPIAQPEFYADIPLKRLIAFGVDTALIVAICLLIVLFTAFTGLLIFPFLLLSVGFVYRVATIANHSATWGMRLVAIEFRTGSGEKFDLTLAFLHTLGLTISLTLPFLQVISVVLMLTGPRAQGLTDHILGTVALNRKAAS